MVCFANRQVTRSSPLVARSIISISDIRISSSEIRTTIKIRDRPSSKKNQCEITPEGVLSTVYITFTTVLGLLVLVGVLLEGA